MRGGGLICHLRQRAESPEVCGWRAGDSLDSRGDPGIQADTWKGSDSGQGLTVCRDPGKATASWPSVWKATVNVLTCGRRSWPGRRTGALVWAWWLWPSLCHPSASVPPSTKSWGPFKLWDALLGRSSLSSSSSELDSQVPMQVQ